MNFVRIPGDNRYQFKQIFRLQLESIPFQPAYVEYIHLFFNLLADRSCTMKKKKMDIANNYLQTFNRLQIKANEGKKLILIGF